MREQDSRCGGPKSGVADPLAQLFFQQVSNILRQLSLIFRRLSAQVLYDLPLLLFKDAGLMKEPGPQFRFRDDATLAIIKRFKQSRYNFFMVGVAQGLIPSSCYRDDRPELPSAILPAAL